MVVIGIGQAGCNIASCFSKSHRKILIDVERAKWQEKHQAFYVAGFPMRIANEARTGVDIILTLELDVVINTVESNAVYIQNTSFFFNYFSNQLSYVSFSFLYASFLNRFTSFSIWSHTISSKWWDRNSSRRSIHSYFTDELPLLKLISQIKFIYAYL